MKPNNQPPPPKTAADETPTNACEIPDACDPSPLCGGDTCIPRPELIRLEAALEPEGWEPPDSLSARDILLLAAYPDRPAAEVLG